MTTLEVAILNMIKDRITGSDFEVKRMIVILERDRGLPRLIAWSECSVESVLVLVDTMRAVVQVVLRGDVADEDRFHNFALGDPDMLDQVCSFLEGALAEFARRHNEP